MPVIKHSGEIELILPGAPVVTQVAVVAVGVLIDIKRTIVMTKLKGSGQARRLSCERSVAQDKAIKIVLTDANKGETLSKLATKYNWAAPRGEVSDICDEWTLAVIDSLDQLWDDKIEICIALPMCVCAQIDRYIVHREGEVRSVIEVESAQEILIRFSFSAVLSGDDAGDSLENFTTAGNRTLGQFARADGSFR